MFEHRSHKVLPRKLFLKRQLKYAAYASIIILVSLFIGVTGYMLTADLSFADAFLNACMILTGMGPVNSMPTDTAKYFSSIFALYSGIAFLTTTTLRLAPAIHRFFHIIPFNDQTE